VRGGYTQHLHFLRGVGKGSWYSYIDGKFFVWRFACAETAVAVKWIAQRLQMGTRTHLNHLLYWPAVKPQNETSESWNRLSALLRDRSGTLASAAIIKNLE
jgi:hypothetical protein